MPTLPSNPIERRLYWLAVAEGQPPERFSAYIEDPSAPWTIVTENGPALQKERYSAYLLRWEEAPYWAFALAKSYLDDVGEWPLTGIETEWALLQFEQQREQRAQEEGETEGEGETENEALTLMIQEAVRTILHTVKRVWPDLEVIYAGREVRE